MANSPDGPGNPASDRLLPARAVTDLEALGEVQIKLDCDVIQADGGTRTASITGAYVALYRALQRCQSLGIVKEIPLIDSVAAVSCGIFNGDPVLDLDYARKIQTPKPTPTSSSPARAALSKFRVPPRLIRSRKRPSWR